MISATREVAAEDVTEVMLLSKEKKWKLRTTKYVTYHNNMSALTTIITYYCLDICYMVLHEPDLGYSNRTPLRIRCPLLEHLRQGRVPGHERKP